MVVKIYISGISGNKEVKKRQQRVLMILDSKSIKYEVIDITEPGRESDKDFMQNNSKSLGGTVSDPTPRSPLPPQMFNDEVYCGDYDQFDLANEVDTLEQFLKLEAPPEEPPQVETEQEKTVNGDATEEKSKEPSQEREPETEKTEGDTAETTETSDKDKENSPVKESSPVKETEEPTKESTPAPQDNDAHDEPKEGSKETTPERQKSVEKSPEKETEAESKEAKESSPEKEGSLNENGSVSSREQSAEKEAVAELNEAVKSPKENPSELLIDSEQAASAE